LTTVTGLPDTQTVDLTSADATFVGVLGISVNSLLLQEVVASNVSEPASMALLAAGLFGIGIIRHRMLQPS
jgi:PEP-CTERM motif